MAKIKLQNNWEFNESGSDLLLTDIGNARDWVFESAGSLRLPTGGGLTRTDNPGAVTLSDFTVTSSPSAGTEQSETLQIDATAFLELYSEADGSGSIQEQKVTSGSVPGFFSGSRTLSNGESVTIESSESFVVSGDYTVNGTMTVNGSFSVT